MAQFFQITENEILSGVCKAIYDVFGDELYIYKDEREYLKLPAVTVYCVDYEKIMERFDRFTNNFSIIINYFQDDNNIINKRQDINSQTEKILEAVKYIELPAYEIDVDNKYIETKLKTRARGISIKEIDNGVKQIAIQYTVRTKYINPDKQPMQNIDINVDKK